MATTLQEITDLTRDSFAAALRTLMWIGEHGTIEQKLTAAATIMDITVGAATLPQG